MQFLFNERKQRGKYHHWDGKDSVCRLWSTGGIKQTRAGWTVVDVAPARDLCHMCDELARRNERTEPERTAMTEEIKLPELPNSSFRLPAGKYMSYPYTVAPGAEVFAFFTEDQIRSYATAAVLAERQRAEQDAKRYRWLRANWHSIEAYTRHGGHAMVLHVNEFGGTLADNALLDTEIDGAMAPP